VRLIEYFHSPDTFAVEPFGVGIILDALYQDIPSAFPYGIRQSLTGDLIVVNIQGRNNAGEIGILFHHFQGVGHEFHFKRFNAVTGIQTKKVRVIHVFF